MDTQEVLDSPEMVEKMRKENLDLTRKYVDKIKDDLTHQWEAHAKRLGLTAMTACWICPNFGNDGYAVYEGYPPPQEELPEYLQGLNLTLSLHVKGTVISKAKADEIEARKAKKRGTVV